MNKKAFLDRAVKEAKSSGHIFPEHAACEAALESTYGTSGLCIKGNNLFGAKQRIHPVFPDLLMPTWEEVDGHSVHVMAKFIAYPDWHTCFMERMKTLIRLRTVYPEYDAALKATDGETFVRTVSKRWSTDHTRGQHVMDIYNEFFGK